MKVRIGWWVNEVVPEVIYKLEQSINQSIQPLSRLWLKGRARKDLATLGRVEKELAVIEVAKGGRGWVGLLFFPSFFSNLSFSPSFLFAPSAVASWLVHSTPDPAVRVQDLARDIALCSWARHFILTVPFSTQVYKWVPANLMLGVTLRWTSIPSRGV